MGLHEWPAGAWAGWGGGCVLRAPVGRGSAAVGVAAGLSCSLGQRLCDRQVAVSQP
jgi:hypothetical protein